MTKGERLANDANALKDPQVRYSDGGRSGTIHYTSHDASFDCWYELAGGTAVAVIGIPAPRHWEARTKTPLSQRWTILQFIGEQVVKDQVQGEGYFLLEQETIMTIYSGRRP